MYATARLAALQAQASAGPDTPSWAWYLVPAAVVLPALCVLALLSPPATLDSATAQAFGPVMALSTSDIAPAAEPGDAEPALTAADLPQAY